MKCVIFHANSFRRRSKTLPKSLIQWYCHGKQSVNIIMGEQSGERGELKTAQIVGAASEAAHKHKQQSDANAQKATFCSALVQHALINKADSKSV